MGQLDRTGAGAFFVDHTTFEIEIDGRATELFTGGQCEMWDHVSAVLIGMPVGTIPHVHRVGAKTPSGLGTHMHRVRRVVANV